MGRLDDLKRLKDSATARMADREGKLDVGKLAGDAVISASGALHAAESVAERSGLTNKEGKISKFKVAKAALHPTKTARTILGATAAEVMDKRASPDSKSTGS